MTLLAASSDHRGVHEPELRRTFGDEYALLAGICNKLLAETRLQLSEQNGLWYKLLNNEKASKFKGLSAEQLHLYQVIEKSGNKGIWTRDMKNQTNMVQQTMSKTLKTLEQRNLVKSVKSVISKSKKLYMLYDMTPSKDITGGPWYTDNEFDHEFIEFLGNHVKNIVESAKSRTANLTEIASAIRTGGVSKVELSEKEVGNLVNMLVYDGVLEEVAPSLAYTAASSGPVYKVAPEIGSESFLTDVPCGVCPVMDACTEGGVISPETCEYMTAWLESAAGADDW